MPLRHSDVLFLSQFPDLKLLRQDGSTVLASEAFKSKKYVLIYFSAHWCPPCQRFTPLLADFYDSHKDRCSFEVLFVSSDREEQRMMDFFQNRSSNYVRRPARLHNGCNGGDSAAASAAPVSPELLPEDSENMFRCDFSSDIHSAAPAYPSVGGDAAALTGPSESILKLRARKELRAPSAGTRIPKASGHGNWLALPFKEADVARFLSRSYSVVSIPKLVVVAVQTSCVVTREGKAMVMKDPDAMSFPWRFAEGSMMVKQEGKRECIVLFLLLIVGIFYYIWGF
ncbi:tryparedoxin-like protein [Leptomonas seymouri]|uniref:Tryparedoxin-like protein n=1 Tax=Leptomonas seymouri TaxID=5684 RepID=A0A0N0P6E5_LEPSE|nr:tryparedoxin-like protein [Leptomonas seymouri]|eukprot:KPI87546.1 tryparedoxin-like protein [Leptomonas seymouri]